LTKDFDVAVAPLSHDEGSNILDELVFDFFEDTCSNEDRSACLKFLHRVELEAKAQVQACKGHTEGVLFGFSTSSGPTCCFSIVAVDAEFSLSIQKLTAGCFGMPPGKKVPQLEKVVDVLLLGLRSWRALCDSSREEKPDSDVWCSSASRVSFNQPQKSELDLICATKQ